VGGKNDNACTRADAFQLSGNFKACESRQVYAEQYDIRAAISAALYCFLARRSLEDFDGCSTLVEYVPQTRSDQSLVVYDEYLNHVPPFNWIDSD
jgi:hypothetical protein